MANATPNKRRRQPGRKAEDIRLAWREQAPAAVFAGKTLADLEGALSAVKQAGEEVTTLSQARSAALKVRDEKLADLSGMLRLIVRGVQGHPEHGEDSPLYRAMGFVPFSERGSGLTRRKPPGNEEAAA